jgi:hypothetical protein
MIDWKSVLRNLASCLGLADAGTPNKKSRRPNVATPASRSGTASVKDHQRSASSGESANASSINLPSSGAPSRTTSSGSKSTKLAARQRTGTGSVPLEGQPPQLRSASQGPFPAPEMKNYPVGFEDCDGVLNGNWQKLGINLTIGTPQSRRRSLCTLGLDFGTAFTKACVQVRNLTYVVDWDRCVRSSSPCFLPSLFSELRDGSCVLGSHQEARKYSHLKMALLGNPSESDQAACVVFIALVTRYIRAWLFTEHRSVVLGYDLVWSMNVGLPASTWDKADTATLYKRLSVAGWNLGAAPGPITLAAARSILESVSSGAASTPTGIDAEMVEAFPEFGAQVHSYRSSAQRQKDLHLLVDVGAGTVDIVTFHIGEENESEINCILEPLVKKLGTHILLGYRAQAAALKDLTWTDTIARMNQAPFEGTFCLFPGSLNSVQEYFCDLLHGSIRKVLHETKMVRYETSPRWEQGVPYFLTGGGRDVDAFQTALLKTAAGRKMIEMSLPVPENVLLGKLLARDFHRLSVAHGLSSPAENLAKTLRKSEVPDLQRPRANNRSDYRDRYIEK